MHWWVISFMNATMFHPCNSGHLLIMVFFIQVILFFLSIRRSCSGLTSFLLIPYIQYSPRVVTERVTEPLQRLHASMQACNKMLSSLSFVLQQSVLCLCSIRSKTSSYNPGLITITIQTQTGMSCLLPLHLLHFFTYPCVRTQSKGVVRGSSLGDPW